MKKTITLLFAFFALFSWQVNAQITSFPYSEDFEGGSLPTGWVKELPGGSADNDITITSSQNHTSGGQYSVRFSSYSSSSDYNQYLFTDTIHVTSPYTQMTFWVKKHDSDESLQWGVSTGTQASADVSTWNDITLSTTWEKVTVDLSAYAGQTIFFAWHYYGDYLYYVYLDDVKIDEPPACADPSGLGVNLVSQTEAELNWTENGSASAWEVEYGPTGFTQGSGTVVSASSNPYSLTGLTAGQTYDYYVRADCGSNTYSNWVGPYTWQQPTFVNDLCSGAVALTVYPQGGGAGNETSATTTGAVDSGMHPSCDDTGTNLDLFYTFTAPSNGKVKVITGGAKGSEIEAAVYDSCGGAESDCQGNSSEKIFEGLTAGNTYVLQVWLDDFNSGDFTIVLEESIYTDPVFSLTSNGDCSAHQFTVDVNVTDLGGASSVTVSDDQGSATQQLTAPGTVTFGPYADGTDVTFTVTNDDNTNVSSSDHIQFFCPPDNDDCAHAIEVASLPYSNTQDATGATNNDGNISTCGYGMNDGVWYKFTVGTANGDITVEVDPTGWDAEVAVYTGSCGSFTCVVNADGHGSGGAETVTFTPTDNTTYYVNVGHYSGSSDGAEGPYTINISGNSTLSAGELTQSDFSFYPNPTTGIIRWNASQSVDHVQITNLTGQVLMNLENPSTNSLDISRLPKGVYLLNVQMGDKQGTYRLIRE